MPSIPARIRIAISRPESFFSRKVNLSGISGHNKFWTNSHPGKEHFKLANCCVLSFIKNNECIFQGPSPHKRKGGYLYCSVLKPCLQFFEWKHINAEHHIRVEGKDQVFPSYHLEEIRAFHQLQQAGLVKNYLFLPPCPSGPSLPRAIDVYVLPVPAGPSAIIRSICFVIINQSQLVYSSGANGFSAGTNIITCFKLAVWGRLHVLSIEQVFFNILFHRDGWYSGNIQSAH